MSANSIPSEVHIENIEKLAQKLQSEVVKLKSSQADNSTINDDLNTIAAMRLYAKVIMTAVDDLHYSWAFGH